MLMRAWMASRVMLLTPIFRKLSTAREIRPDHCTPQNCTTLRGSLTKQRTRMMMIILRLEGPEMFASESGGEMWKVKGRQ
ncbi:hypothetical protein EAG_07679 [Camponotus floridanus]|uniref:Secreted protein n=1 Tax=Camponotus floridanus TaxID=104421 RepID=E2ANV8_CAMFO|nr:hypothetical protein EAG_07679 [Camponotus floridanus]